MQEEIDNRTIALSVRTGEVGARLTERVFRAAIQKHLSYRQQKAYEHTYKKGKQSIQSLMRQGKPLTSIEINDQNIGSFSRIARKYGIDFSLKKDMTSKEGHYFVFFKAQDEEVLTKAFQEYSKTSLKQKSVLKEKINQMKTKAKSKQKQRHMLRQRQKGMER